MRSRVLILVAFVMLFVAQTVALLWISEVSKSTDRRLKARQVVQAEKSDRNTLELAIKQNGTIRCLLNAVNPDRCLRRQEIPRAKRGPLPRLPEARLRCGAGSLGSRA